VKRTRLETKETKAATTRARTTCPRPRGWPVGCLQGIGGGIRSGLDMPGCRTQRSNQSPNFPFERGERGRAKHLGRRRRTWLLETPPDDLLIESKALCSIALANTCFTQPMHQGTIYRTSGQLWPYKTDSQAFALVPQSRQQPTAPPARSNLFHRSSRLDLTMPAMPPSHHATTG